MSAPIFNVEDSPTMTPGFGELVQHAIDNANAAAQPFPHEEYDPFAEVFGDMQLPDRQEDTGGGNGETPRFGFGSTLPESQAHWPADLEKPDLQQEDVVQQDGRVQDPVQQELSQPQPTAALDDASGAPQPADATRTAPEPKVPPASEASQGIAKPAESGGAPQPAKDAQIDMNDYTEFLKDDKGLLYTARQFHTYERVVPARSRQCN